METSTPRRSQNLRRSVLTAAAAAATTSTVYNYNSPLRRNRRSELSIHDNEKEQSARRSRVQMDQRVSHIGSTSSPLGDVTSVINESEIKDQLHICTKLYTENRISAKNVWKLQIIDVMRSMTINNISNVLQIAGSSLDIGAKVYGMRVDDVYTKGLQLASSMSKGDHKPSEGGDDENPNQSAVDQGPRKRSARKKNRKMSKDKTNIIDKEEKGLHTIIKHIDSVVFSTTENIEVSSQDNLFTNKIPVNVTNHQFMLLSKDKQWTNEIDVILENPDQLLDIAVSQPTHYKTCVPFKEFEIGTWNPDEEALQLAQLAVDDHGIPFTDLDGSVHDIFEEDVDDHLSEVEEIQDNFKNEAHMAVDHIQDAIPEEHRVENDYTYNPTVKTTSGKYIDRMWAGPSHWKVKCSRRSSVRFSGCQQHVVKYTRKTKAVPQTIDFSDLNDLDLSTVKKYVSKRTPQTVPFEKITLPLPDLTAINFKKETDELCFKPGVLRKKLLNHIKPKTNDADVKVYNYDNPNDSMYCSQNSADDLNNDEPPIMDDAVENEPPLGEMSPSMSQQSQQNFVDENLVSAPELVSATQIKYALHAKRMDMKKLKNTIWKTLTQNEGQSTKIKPIKFSMLYQKSSQFLPSDMKKELTCPLALVALLHLCNENNLELRQDPSYKDLTIVKA